MRVRELYNQLAHDLKAHGDIPFVVEVKLPDGSLVRYNFTADRYVSMDEHPKYVLRMAEKPGWLDSE